MNNFCWGRAKVAPNLSLKMLCGTGGRETISPALERTPAYLRTQVADSSITDPLNSWLILKTVWFCMLNSGKFKNIILNLCPVVHSCFTKLATALSSFYHYWSVDSYQVFFLLFFTTELFSWLLEGGSSLSRGKLRKNKTKKIRRCLSDIQLLTESSKHLADSAGLGSLTLANSLHFQTVAFTCFRAFLSPYLVRGQLISWSHSAEWEWCLGCVLFIKQLRREETVPACIYMGCSSRTWRLSLWCTFFLSSALWLIQQVIKYACPLQSKY